MAYFWYIPHFLFSFSGLRGNMIIFVETKNHLIPLSPMVLEKNKKVIKMNPKIEQIASQNREILDNFFREAQKILYCQAPVKAKMKMLYGARYWADYFIQLNNLRLKEELRLTDR